jgi:hypothetical protein
MVTLESEVRVMVTPRDEMSGYGHSTYRIQKMNNYIRLKPQKRLDNEV